MSSETLHRTSFVFPLHARRRHRRGDLRLWNRERSREFSANFVWKCSAGTVIEDQFHLHSVSKKKKKTFLCANLQLERRAINRDISPRSHLCHTGCLGDKVHARAHLWYGKKGVLWQEFFQRWSSREHSAAGNVDLEGSQVEQNLNN